MNTPLRLALAALALAASPLACAQVKLLDSSPAKGQVLEAPPIEIRLTFSEHVEPRTSSIKLVSASGRHFDADRPHADKADPRNIVASVPVLRPGAYRARWSVVGADGRRARGDLSFSVK